MQSIIDDYGVEWRTLKVTSKNGKVIEVKVSEKGELEFLDLHGHLKKTFGNKSALGYMFQSIGGKSYCVHRLVAKCFYDEDLPLRREDNPAIKTEVDHRNGVRFDNTIGNLRLVSSHKANCTLPESKKRYREANQKMGRHGWVAIEAIDARGKTIARFEGKLVYQQIRDWLAEERGIDTTLASVRSSIISFFNKLGVCTAFKLRWKRIKAENYKPSPYRAYQLAYHRMWRQRQKEKAKNLE